MVALHKEQYQLIYQLYIEMYDYLLDYAIYTLADKRLAEEAVQDTFRIACAKADALLASPNPRGWLLLRCRTSSATSASAAAAPVWAS